MDSGETVTIPVFVNGSTLYVEPGTTAGAAAAQADARYAEAAEAGRAYLTDGRGIRRDPSESLAAGDILRVIVSAARDLPEAASNE